MVYIGQLVHHVATGAVQAIPCRGIRAGLLTATYAFLRDDPDAWEPLPDGGLVTYVSVPAEQVTTCCVAGQQRVAAQRARGGRGLGYAYHRVMRSHLQGAAATLYLERVAAACLGARSADPDSASDVQLR